MSIVKFQNYSAIKNEQHTPRAIAGSDLKNGYAVVIKYVDGKETATVPTATEAKEENIWFVHNVITTPELDNYDDFVIKAGKPVRAFSFTNAVREIVEISGDLVTGSVTVGDTLVANTSGHYVKTSTPGDYKVVLKVIDFNTVGGKGYDCVVTIN